MSRHIEACPDPIRISEGGRIVGRTPRTLERWAKAGRLTIYRDETTLIRFVSRVEVEALAPGNGNVRGLQAAVVILDREVMRANRLGFTSIAGKLTQIRDEIAGLLEEE